MSPKRGAGARVGVGMLSGRGIPLNEKVSKFQSVLVSWFLGLLFLGVRLLGVLVSCLLLLVFKVSKFQT